MTAATATVTDPNTSSSMNVSQAQAPHSPTNPNSNTDQTISYSAERIIGNGSFGVVFQASVVETGEIVAIKKVLQDKRFKNRELQIMRQLVKDSHSNIVTLKHCFYSQVRDVTLFVFVRRVCEGNSTCCTLATHNSFMLLSNQKGDTPDELYLNLVLEYVPETVYSISRQHSKAKIALPILYVKLYLYQLSRALSHIHCLGICHRDIKPQNLLVNPETQQLKLCDFGSAKALVKGEPNVAYICSRYYRAPELIFGSTDYTTAIDVWSQGKREMPTYDALLYFCFYIPNTNVMIDFIHSIRLCWGRIASRSTTLPWRFRCGPTCRDHQSSGDSHPRRNLLYESQLHGV